MTKKLYYEALYRTEFDAAVIRQEKKDGQFHAVLDQTVFYPEGGGQPGDMGRLDEAAVERVYEQGGEIFHVVNQALAAPQVHGVIDWERRFDLMQQHLGQHILSAVFVRDFSANTVSIRLDRDKASIDLDGQVNDGQIERAEALANAVIYHNESVQVLYPNREEIERNSRRKIPQTSEAIRIIKIGDLDYVPCSGTHPKATGEVGIIKVQKAEVQKSGSRIHFVCGQSALRWIAGVCRDSLSLQQELSCGQGDLVARVLKQRDDVQELKQQKQALMVRLADADALELIKDALRVGEVAVVAHLLPETTQEEMKLLFSSLAEHPGVIILLGGTTSSGAFLMFGGNKADKRIDVREAFKSAVAIIGGKGGGSASYAQGFGPDGVRLKEALESALAITVRPIP